MPFVSQKPGQKSRLRTTGPSVLSDIMNLRISITLLFSCLVFAVACAPRRVNIEAPLVQTVISEFTEARLAHYLHGGAPLSNAELLDKVLSRHALKLSEFKPVLRRFEPQLEAKLLKP